MFDMAEGRGAEREDRGADLRVGDHLDAEDVGEAGPAVVAEGAEDEIFALLVEDEDAGEHFGGEGWRQRTGSGELIAEGGGGWKP